MKPGLFSSDTDEWETPQALFDSLNSVYNFQLDACATADNAKCKSYFNKAINGLIHDWHPFGSVWMNPPYGRQIGHWMAKALIESRKGCIVVCLVPARTDTDWWHKYCMKGEITFLRGRLKFSNCIKGRDNNSAPFPSALVVFKPPKNAKINKKEN